MAQSSTEWRAIFEYPTPWDKNSPVTIGYGYPRDRREVAENEPPIRPEETHGRNVGVQRREVTPWEDA